MHPSSQDSASDPSATAFRHVLIGALIFSLLAHLGLAFWFHNVPLPHFSAEQAPRLVPPSFTVHQVTIDESQLGQKEEPAKPTPAPRHEIALPQDSGNLKAEIEEVRALPTASAPELTKPLLSEKPHVDVASLQALAPQPPSATESMDKDLAAMSQKLIQDATKNPNQPKLNLSDLAPKGDTDVAASATGAPNSGYSNLEELLGRGKLTGPVKPLNLPGGALFDYDKFELLPAAVATMQKLGQLIQKSPQATFTVEGYADSFGSPEHNLALSQQRAEAVKNWLVTNMAVDPNKITAVGYGSTKLRVPATGDVNAQAPNRRVEIVIKTPE